MKLSKDGYKRNSKDVNNPYNIIPSGDITMKGVDFPVMGTDNLGNQQLMQPGFDYKFPGNMVFEQPVQDKPTNKVKQRRTERDNKLLPNYNKQMGDVSTHLMTTIEMTDDDGSPIYMAIPMLYPTVEGQETPDPTSWTEFQKGEEQDAFKMALERGEVYYFNSAEEADAFAKGGYKTPNLKKKKHGGEDSEDDYSAGLRNFLRTMQPVISKVASRFVPMVNMLMPLSAGEGSTKMAPYPITFSEEDMQVYEVLLGKKYPKEGINLASPEFEEFTNALNLALKADSIKNSIAEQFNLEYDKPNYQSTGEVDNTEVKDYFTAYLKSPLFKRRAIELHGEDNWESVRDAKLKRLENTEVDFSGEEEWLDIYNQENPTLRDIMYASRRIPEIQSRYKRPNYMGEGNENPIIKVNPGQAITQQEDLNLSYNPFNSIVANEYSHALGATSGSLDPFPYPMTEEEIRLSEQRKPNAPYDSHDSNFWEMKSDIDTTRYELWKAGLYNFEEDFMFDQSHIDYIRNNPDKFIKDENLFKQYDDDVIIDQMNIYTDVGTTPFAVGKFGTELPKAQWYNPFDPKYKTLYQSVKNLFSPSSKYPKGTHNFTNAPKFPIDESQAKNYFHLLDNRKYETFPEWQRYIAANQPVNVNYQLPTLLNDPSFNNLVNNKGLINTNALKSYINKTKGLNNTQLYDRQKLKSVFESLDLNNQKFVDENTFLKEAAKYTEPLPIFPNLKSIPMGSNTELADYWQGSNNPFEFNDAFKKPDFSIPRFTDPHVLQTYLPTSPGVPMWDRNVGSSHFKPLENPEITKKIGNVTYTRDPEGLGGLTLGHSRVAFDPAYPNTTIEIERQSDYAQRFNLKQQASASNPLGLNERDEYIDKLKTGKDDIVPNIGLLNRHKEFMAEFNAMSDEDIANSLTRRAIGSNPDAPLVRNLNRYYINNRSHGSKDFNELTNDELLTIAKNPAFKNYLKTKENQLKTEYDQSVLNFEDLKETQKTELYNIENPNELSLNLKEYRKNAPAILLSELVDYSTKLGNTHLHIPLAETVAKTQGYNADKFGAPNPLYTKHKWTGHSWNEFLSQIDNTLGNLTRSSVPGKESLGPFTFEKNKNAEIIVTYKKPDGNIINISGDFTDRKSEIEEIRNNFLKNEGYDPNVDYKSNSEAYKPEHQTILNKSTEKEIKKNIEAVFGKNYPYEIITDLRGNKYVRLDHTGTRLPIKGLDKYKYGGSLPKAQLQLTKYYDEIANLLGKADDYKNILPSPTISTVPYQKLLTFDQTGKVIPQQHMVNPFRGESSLDDALNDLYSGQPMWFAPVGDTRYFDRSLEAFGKVNEDALNFVPGSGRPIMRYIRNQKGNTGKWGINEYPLTDAEKLTKINKGYDYKYVVDENGNGKYVVDYDSPIMRQELITKPDFQSKIIGDFAPDIKFKIFKDFDLSKQGHAMHKVWQPEEFQSILDEGFDAIQLVKDGVQIENILLNPDKFKIRSINEIPVTIDNPPFKKGGSIKDRYKKKLPKFQMQGQNNPGWLANRLYKSVTPIGYNMDQAMIEMLYGERQPFMWDGVETSFDDFQNHPRFKDNPNFGEYIKKASEDLWGMYLGFDQKHNTVSKSKFKPTLGVEDDKSIYYSFNNVDDIMDDIIERGITKDASKDKWQINDSAAGGFNLNNYQISRGMDDERELPYYAYYDEYDFDIPTGLGFNIEGESIVGKPFNIYGRIYYHPDTKELIPPSELNANWVDFEKLKQGVAYAESLNGELMINPESTATGLYGQRFSEISTMYDGSRQDFANDIEAQNEYFENRYRGKLEGVKGLRESGIDLYKEYSKQIPNFPYTTTEVAALVNFLGRQGTREYLGYVLRDGNSLESVFPDKYGVNAGQANKTPQEYIEKFNEGITKKKMGGEVDKVTDRLIKKYENGDKLTPAGTKHLKSLGMI